MSVVINDKPRRQRALNWRWPFSRQITLSFGTLVVILAVWWTVAALQLISPLFLPPPGQVLQKLMVIAGPQGFMDATLWQHLAASLTRIVIALLAAVLLGVPVGIAMGLSPTMRGILDPIIELYRPVPPLAYLPLMVIWFGIGETLQDPADLSGDFRPCSDVGVGGGEKRAAGRECAPHSHWEPAVRRCCGLLFCRGHCRRYSQGCVSGLAWAGRRWWQQS